MEKSNKKGQASFNNSSLAIRSAVLGSEQNKQIELQSLIYGSTRQENTSEKSGNNKVVRIPLFSS
jgi:hypothetical protein